MYEGSFLWALENYEVFLILGVTNSGITTDQLGVAIDEEIENIKTKGITQKELDAQTNKLEKQFIDDNSTIEGVVENLSDYYLFYHVTNLINTEIETYRSITVYDVKRVANKYLNKNQRVRLIVFPEKK